MITGKEDLLQSLIEAFLMEKGTNEFYSLASRKAVAPEAKKMFGDLSDWEEKHMDFIQFLYLSIQDDRDIKKFAEFKAGAAAPVTEGGMPVKDLEARIEKFDFIDDTGAIMLALEIEGKAFSLYRKMSEKASDTNAQVVFREMMEQELGHIDYLKEMRKKVAKTS
jgi:rubrerythrin